MRDDPALRCPAPAIKVEMGVTVMRCSACGKQWRQGDAKPACVRSLARAVSGSRPGR